ncbi:hypothetical protein LUZ60_017312 [Juncus effusus]|nr:hypothetical protein LUZ60_017312 [Juncus effusus]
MKLAVEVVDATGLTPKDGHGSCNPFVQVEFDRQRQRTTTKLKALSPSWNETFLFELSDPSILRDLAIEISVFHDHLADHSTGDPRKVRRRFFASGHGEQHSFLGYARISGDAIASSPSTATVKSFQLKKRGVFSHVRGDIAIRVSVIPDSDKALQGSLVDLWRMKTQKKSEFMPNERLPNPDDYLLKEIRPIIPAFHGRKSSEKTRPGPLYDLVQTMKLFYVHIMKARNLPTSTSPYVETCAFNYQGFTKPSDEDQEPMWNEVFAFPCQNIQSELLRITVKDKGNANDGYVGRISLDLEKCGFFGNLQSSEGYETEDIMGGALPNPDTINNMSIAPQWYKLEDQNEQEFANGEIMISMWLGTQADEAFQDSWRWDKGHIKNNRSMIYYSPKLVYLHLLAIGAKDLVPVGTSRLTNASLKVQIGEQIRQTAPVLIIGAGNPTWNEELIFVATDPSDEPIVITLVDHIAANCEELLGSITLSISNIPRVHELHSKPVQPKWHDLTKPGAQIIAKVQLCVSLDFRYHVIDESPRKSSDFQPASKDLTRSCIGKLEVGIIGIRALVPMKVRKGIPITDAYCVAKYGPKWVRTRTVVDSLSPRWNEQYFWDVFDLCTVFTIAAFDDCRFGPQTSNDARDNRIGNISIRLSNLESGRIYAHSYPLLILLPSGLKKMGELQLVVRFTCSSWVKTMARYGTPLEPKIHYMQPISEALLDGLQRSAVQTICRDILARADPSIPKEVVEYLLESDLSSVWSIRKSKAEFFRVMAVVSGIFSFVKWLNDIRAWKKPIMTVLVDALFVILVCFPWIIPPGIFFSLFLINIWNYKSRPELPQHVDVRLSRLDGSHPDELDEEFDDFPSTRSSDILRMRYDRLRSVLGRVQTVAADCATQGERLRALLSWQDTRATTICVTLLFLTSFSLYLLPSRVTFGIIGLYLLNWPSHDRLPSVPLNFFRRSPGNLDLMLC